MSSSKPATAALQRLVTDGLVERSGPMLRTTRRWQGAMARAALRLYAERDPGEDLRVPITLALLEVYGSKVEDDELVDLVGAMLPVEAHSLGVAREPAPSGD